MQDLSRCPDARVDALALALAPGIGPRSYHELVLRHGTAGAALAAALPPSAHMVQRGEAQRALEHAARCGARLVLSSDPDYPRALLDLGDPPPYLFTLGDLAVLQRPVVAMVGTRRATPYGERVTHGVAGALAAAGACVVSGMARGIDGAAHRAALARGGVTAAVLGTGVDVAYPVGHRSLHAAIASRGVLISEFPCGARPTPGSFPRRNRLIAALARLTIVVEAGRPSGALNTVEHASDLGRDVAAVPGPIDAPQSVGANELIRDGAHAITSSADALMLAGFGTGHRLESVAPSLQGDERVVWDALEQGAVPIDLLTERATLTPRRTLAAVTGLELAGLVDTLPGGEVTRRGR